ncbi:MAG: tripartite tricarboxylate transporter substrate binding protein [Burkholderiaceae bacterium]|jgi:tripartite-type tricarboxylate transporter receptor subunit TctC|nr:tripartite tricarboxylate transporter substrate binding protein [Burkholderiaceae bacterium]
MPTPYPVANRRRLLTLAAAGLAAPYAGLHTLLAHAQQSPPSGFPSKPITLYVPFSPGGATDSLARALADLAGKTLGQTVVVENKLGAAGTMGAVAMLHAPANGYTLSITPEAVLRQPYLQKTEYDPLEDFTYIILLAGYPLGVATRADAPWKQWSDLVADAKRNPGKITYGSTGTNGSMHLTMMEICQKAGIELTHVPYKGETEIITAMIGGHIDLGITASAISPFIDSGKARWLVRWPAARSKRWPDAPTLREVGIDMDFTGPFGISAPKGMEPGIVKILHDAFRQALAAASTVKLMEQLELENAYLDSAGYDRHARRICESQMEVVKRLGLNKQPS